MKFHTSIDPAELELLPELSTNLLQIELCWSDLVYQPSDQHTQLAGLETLVEFAKKVANTFPQHAETLAWQGIVFSALAELSPIMAALKPAKEALVAFKQSLEIDETALEATAHTSLGALFTQVPGRPFGFGSATEAKKHLSRALELFPDDIEANFYYAEYLAKFESLDDATETMQKTLLLALAQSDRSVSLEKRKQEIQQRLQQWQTPEVAVN